ncbi:MAG: rhomboid family intramembrane serine protease [Planctomycetota bacterium]
MDLNYVLIWVVGAAALVLLVRAVLARRLGWVTAAGLVGGVLVGAVTALPQAGGYVGAGAFAVVVVLPLFGYRLVLRRTFQQEYGRARRLASVVRWLHPADGWRELPRLLGALETGDPETIAGAAADLQGKGASRTGIGRVGAALLFRMSNRWRELLDWIETEIPAAELRRDPNMVGLHLRALGELGRPNALVAAFADWRKSSEARTMWLSRNLCRLMAFAFCGRRDLVERLLDGPLDVYPEPVQRFWRATADLAAGRTEQARATLEALRGQCDPLTEAGVERRLTEPLPVAEGALTPETRERLARFEAELSQEERYGGRARAVRRTAYATYALIVLNLAAFGVELALGGSMDLRVLYRMGALVPAAVAQGAWWRMVTALFLHFGPVHLLANALGLLILGPFVEFAVGRVRFLAAYFAAGLGSMVLVVAVMLGGEHAWTPLVGASGGIMGLVGATMAVHLRGWVRERALLSGRRLIFLGAIIVFQTAFDLTTPESSFLAHFGGVVIGFLAASLMRHRVSVGVPGGGAEHGE